MAQTSTFQPIPRFSRDDLAKPERQADRRIDLAYKASRWYLRGATGLDVATTVIGIEGFHGIETGWAKCFGRNNAAGVTAANGVVDYGVEFASRKIFRMGGRWRLVATVINVARATGIAADGIHNVAFIRRH